VSEREDKHLHGHRARRTGKISTARREAIKAHTHLGENLDGRADIDGIAAKMVEFGHDENV